MDDSGTIVVRRATEVAVPAADEPRHSRDRGSRARVVDTVRQQRARVYRHQVERLVRHPVAESRERRYQAGLALADMLAVLIALGATALAVGDIEPLLFLAVPAVVVIAKLGGLYDRDQLLVRKTTIHEIPALFNHATRFALGTLIVLAVFDSSSFGAAMAVLMWGTLFVSTVLLRRTARMVVRNHVAPERILFVGDAGAYLRLADKLELGEVNAELIGRMSLHRGSPLRSQERVVDVEALRSIVDDLDVHRVIVEPSQVNPEATLEMVRSAKLLGVRVSIVPQVMDVVGTAVTFDDVMGVTLLGVRSFNGGWTIKRAMDICGAAVGLLLLAPLFALIAIAIKLDSPGPVFFRQKRVGRRDEGFEIVKFRSMVADAEQRKPELRELGYRGGLFKIANDPRITRVGAFLRKTSLDELPQLINVLRGEMSLVGPRPLILSEDEAITGLDRQRLRLTPGMTGPWQLMGSKATLAEMVKLDYVYVTGWSLMEDIGILLRTVRHVFSRRGL